MAALAIAGIIAPIWFTLLVIIQGLLQPDYSHVAMPISALAAWPYGWVQNLNFYVYSGLIAAYAVGLHLGIRQTRGGWLGPALLVLTGAGTLVAGIFPWRQAGGAFIEPAGHIVGAVMHFVGAGSALVVISNRLKRDPSWRDLTSFVLMNGTAILILFFAFGAFAISDNAPLRPWTGAIQRLIVGLWFICVMVMAARLLRMAKVSR